MNETFPLDPSGRPLVPLMRLDALNRFRKEIGSTTDLEDSIKDLGLLHAITVYDQPNSENKYPILAGERRWRSFLNLICSPEGLTRFGSIPVRFVSDLTLQEQLQIEGDENVKRKDFLPVEQWEITARIDQMKRELHGSSAGSGDHGWTDKKTADLRGVTPGTVSSEKKIVRLMNEDPTLRATIKEKKMPLRVAIKYAEQKKDAARYAAQVAAGAVQVEFSFQLGDCRKLILDLPDNSVSLILTDPPFGNSEIASRSGSTGGEGGGQTYLANLEQSDNLSGQEVTDLMLELAPQLFRVLKPGCHFYIFYTTDLRNVLANILRVAGLTVTAPDLIWDKGRNMNAFSGYNYMSRYEPVLFGYKPDKTIRRQLAKPLSNIILVPPVSTDERVHGFQKPRDLLTLFIQQSSHPGETVLDPFGGSASTLFAARACNRSGLGFEVNEKNWTQGQKQLKEGAL